MRRVASALFAIVGLAVVSVNTANNVVEINATAWAWDTTAIIVCLSLLSVTCSVFLASIVRVSKIAGVVALVVVTGCMVTSVRLTADRIGGIERDASQAVQNRNGRIARLDRRIADLRSELVVQRAIVARECARFHAKRHKPEDWPKCFNAKARVTAAEAEVPGLVTQRNALGERAVVQRHSERFLGWILGPGAGRASAMIQPVMIALLLEIGGALSLSISGLFLAWRVTTRCTTEAIEPVSVECLPADPVVALLRQSRRALSNNEIAAALGVSAPAAHKRVTVLVENGTVTRQRVGREVAIRLN